MEGKKNTQKRGKKSYYYKFFLSFMVVLIVPMLTILLIFLSSQSIIRGQILRASENTLKQFFSRVDDVLGEAQEVCVTIVNSNDSKSNSKKLVDQFEKRAIYAGKIQKQLKGYMGEKYLDIFEYYPGKDYVISANNASMNLDSYYELYYGDGKTDFREEFKAVANTSRKKPMLLGMNGKSSDSYLCIAMRQVSYKDEKYDYVLVIVLRPDYVTKLLENVVDGEQNGVSMILDAGQEGIFSTDDVVYAQDFNEKDYIIQKQESKVMDADYVYAVPYSYFWSKLFFLYIICGIGMAVSVALGIFIAFRQTNKVYQPVGSIVNELQKQASVTYDAGENTEFEFIKMLFDEEKREKLILNKTIRRGQEYQRTNFIFSLLNGSNEISESTEDIFTENGMALCSDCFCVAFLSLQPDHQMKSKTAAFVVTNVFEELCCRVARGYVAGLGDTEFALLVNLNHGNEKKQLLLALEEGKAFLEKYYNMKLTIGISAVQEGMQGIHIAYQETRQALSYSFLLGKNRIIDYEEIGGREFRYPQAPELKMLHMVSDYLTGDEEEAAASLVEELTADYEINKNASLETMECFEFEAVSMFHRSLMQEGLWTAEWRERIMKLLQQETLEAFKAYFAELLMQLHRKKGETAGEEDVCARVKEYIDAHYGEEQLSRTLLSEMFGIAPGYLSKLFKEKYQFTIPEYISRTRVDNAKTLLKNTALNVSEIAEKTGFVNSASFIRTFKRQEGITPNVYREFFNK